MKCSAHQKLADILFFKPQPESRKQETQLSRSQQEKISCLNSFQVDFRGVLHFKHWNQDSILPIEAIEKFLKQSPRVPCFFSIDEETFTLMDPRLGNLIVEERMKYVTRFLYDCFNHSKNTFSLVATHFDSITPNSAKFYLFQCRDSSEMVSTIGNVFSMSCSKIHAFDSKIQHAKESPMDAVNQIFSRESKQICPDLIDFEGSIAQENPRKDDFTSLKEPSAPKLRSSHPLN
eukprot:Sdes_comp24052_c0_seq1m22118